MSMAYRRNLSQNEIISKLNIIEYNLVENWQVDMV